MIKHCSILSIIGCLLRERTMLFNSWYYISIAFKNIFHEFLIFLTAIGNSSEAENRTHYREVMGLSQHTAIIIFLAEGKKNDCETYVSHIQIIIKLVKYFGFRRGLLMAVRFFYVLHGRRPCWMKKNITAMS